MFTELLIASILQILIVIIGSLKKIKSFQRERLKHSIATQEKEERGGGGGRWGKNL